MDCQTCEPLLLDIAYGELAPRAQSEARTHLARCAQCSAALTRIESGLAFAKRLPMVEPPTALTERLMAAAREQVPTKTNATPRVSLLEQWADLLRRFAMARQVQMATVMLLIMMVGVWSVPQLTRKREAQGGTVINPEPDGEAGPSAGLAPATPLDLAVDPRTGRIRSKGELAEAARARPEAPKLNAAEGKAPSDEDALRAAAPEADSLALGAALEQENAPAPAPAEAPAADEAFAERSARARRSASAKSDNAVMDNPYSRGGSAFTGGDGLDTDLSRKEKKSASAEAAPSPATAVTATTLYARAMESYRAGDYESARASFEALLARSDASSQRSAALLYLARSERAEGRCDLAATHYEAIVLRQPGSVEAPPALAEAVGCYDQLGQPARADSLLARASQTPALAARAKQAASARSGNVSSSSKAASAPKAAAKPAVSAPKK